MKLKVVIHEAEEGGYWGTVPALPGCVSEGDTWEEMLANIREAIECYLDVLDPPVIRQQRQRKPQPRAAHAQQGKFLLRLRRNYLRGQTDEGSN